MRRKKKHFFLIFLAKIRRFWKNGNEKLLTDFIECRKNFGNKKNPKATPNPNKNILNINNVLGLCTNILTDYKEIFSKIPRLVVFIQDASCYHKRINVNRLCGYFFKLSPCKILEPMQWVLVYLDKVELLKTQQWIWNDYSALFLSLLLFQTNVPGLFKRRRKSISWK